MITHFVYTVIESDWVQYYKNNVNINFYSVHEQQKERQIW
jgi:hypothetical protein